MKNLNLRFNSLHNKKVVKQFFWDVQSSISWLVASTMFSSWVDVSSNRKPGVTWHKSSFPPNKIRNTAGKIWKTHIYHLSTIFSPPQKKATKTPPTIFLKLTPLSPLAHACCTCPSCTTGVHALTSVSNTPASQVIPQRWCFLRRTGWTWKRSKWRNMRFFLKPVTSSYSTIGALFCVWKRNLAPKKIIELHPWAFEIKQHNLETFKAKCSSGASFEWIGCCTALTYR